MTQVNKLATIAVKKQIIQIQQQIIHFFIIFNKLNNV